MKKYCIYVASGSSYEQFIIKADDCSTGSNVMYFYVNREVIFMVGLNHLMSVIIDMKDE